MSSDDNSSRAARPSETSRNILTAPGRVPALIVLAALTAFFITNPLLDTIRLRVFDLEQRIAPRGYEAVPVRIVAIDEKSVDKYGQWPWPRTLLSQLVRQIAQGAPSVLGVDILFPEPDRFSPDALVKELPEIPASVARELEAMEPNDQALADTFRLVPTVLLVGAREHALRRAPRFSRSRRTIVSQIGGNPFPFLSSYPPPVRSVPELTEVERGRGSDIGQPDSDGIVRRVPLFVITEGNLMPALSLEVLRVASGAGSIGIITSRTGIRGAKVGSPTVGSLFIPTDGKGRAYPYFTLSYEARYVSAFDILGGSYDLSKLRGAAVFLGVTALGLVDQRQTPLGPMAGVEVHAQLLESMLTGNLLRRPPILTPIEIGLVITIGLLTIFALPYRQPSFAIAVVGVAVLLLVGSEFASFRLFRLLFDGVYPAIANLVVLSVMLGANLRSAEAARRNLLTDLEHERQMEARIEGELKAASAIQMGLLPRHFPAAPEHCEVDLYAFLEPAREIGGDLYDFFFLESGRLSFVIADVAGKGVPAALFMATTKEVLHAATQRYADALDRVFAEANAKISGSSSDMAAGGADMMFVTVFAGVLDLTSGLLSYVNAGHDWPFLIRSGIDPAQLSGDSGPPLGAIDEFAYRVQRRQLTAGDMLLLYTDGVTEAQDAARSFYGDNRLKQALASHTPSDARAAIEVVRDDVRRFVAGAEQFDDIALLAVRWLGQPLSGG